MLPFLLAMLAAASTCAELITLDPKLNISHVARCHEDSVDSCQAIRLNLAKLEDKEISLLGGSELILVERPGNDIFVFSNDKGAEAIFSRNNGRVFGTIQTDKGESYVIEPCSKSNNICHLLITQNIDMLNKLNEKDNVVQPQNGGEDYMFEFTQEALEQRGKDDKTTEETYTLKVYYTYEFRDAVDSVSTFINVMLASMNRAYRNSKIPVRVKLHCIELANLHDNPDGQKMLKQFANLKKDIRQTADAAMLLVNKFNYCGIGYARSWDRRRYRGESLTAVARSCAVGRMFTSGHELGHNFGCGHDRYEGPRKPWQTPYAWGKHFSPLGDGYRSIMAYVQGPDKKYWNKVNLYSSPDVKDLKTDAMTGTAKEDCARVIRENRFVFAAQGDESDISCQTTLAVPLTTIAPTTLPPRTVAPTTVAPTTAAPKTVAPTTFSPTTIAPTTVARTKVAPTTVRQTTANPTKTALTTVAPTTTTPTTISPTSVPSTQKGIWLSPNFPSNYPNNLRKIKPITVAEGSVVKVRFISFDLEGQWVNRWGGRNCVDYLSAKDGDGTVLMKNSCGSFLPKTFTSKTNKVVFTFVTDESSALQGFELSWKAIREH